MAHPIFFRRQILLFLSGTLCVGSLMWYLKLSDLKSQPEPATGSTKAEECKVILAVVSCGGRFEEAMTMLKSAVLFSREVSLHVLAIVDLETRQNFTKSFRKFINAFEFCDHLHNFTGYEHIELLLVEAMKADMLFTYEIKDTWFPSRNKHIWTQLYAPCSAQRIFLPSLLPEADGVLYMDSDTVFISELRSIWNHFSLMNEHQWAGLVNEDEPGGDGWYNTKAEVPYFKPRGLNTGVLLLNLTRMRFYEAEQKAEKVLRLYGDKLYWGDQDIFNVMFSWNPEFVYRLPCEYNFRESHCDCRYSGNCSCESAAINGVRIVHGNLKAFHKEGFFQRVYKTFEKHSLFKAKASDLSEELQRQYNIFWNSSQKACVGSSQRFFKQVIALTD